MGKIIEGPWKRQQPQTDHEKSVEAELRLDSFIFEDEPRPAYSGTPIVDPLFAAAAFRADKDLPT
jgi:hypothetical protein